jgi:hypothetical protein
MRGGGGLIQFPTKGDTKSNSIIKRGKLKCDYIPIYIKIYLTRNANKRGEGMRGGGGLTLQEF